MFEKTKIVTNKTTIKGIKYNYLDLCILKILLSIEWYSITDISGQAVQEQVFLDCLTVGYWTESCPENSRISLFGLLDRCILDRKLFRKFKNKPFWTA